MIAVLIMLIFIGLCTAPFVVWYIHRRRLRAVTVKFDEAAAAIATLTSAPDAYGREDKGRVAEILADTVEEGKTSFEGMAERIPTAERYVPPPPSRAWGCRTRFLMGAHEERGGAAIYTIPDDAKEEELKELGEVYHFDRTPKLGDRIEILGGRVMLESNPGISQFTPIYKELLRKHHKDQVDNALPPRISRFPLSGSPGPPSTSKTNQEAYDRRTKIKLGDDPERLREILRPHPVLTIPPDAKVPECEDLRKRYHFHRTPEPGDRIEMIGGEIYLEAPFAPGSGDWSEAPRIGQDQDVKAAPTGCALPPSSDLMIPPPDPESTTGKNLKAFLKERKENMEGPDG